MSEENKNELPVPRPVTPSPAANGGKPDTSQTTISKKSAEPATASVPPKPNDSKK